LITTDEAKVLFYPLILPLGEAVGLRMERGRQVLINPKRLSEAFTEV
jgi:hypothetical protein